MSKTTKIVLSIVGVLVLLAALATFAITRLVDSFATGDAADTIGQEIVAHQLPPTISADLGFNVLGVRTMIATSPSGEAFVMILEIPGEDFDQASEEAETAFRQQSGSQVNFEFQGSRTETINGDAVQVDTLVGQDGDTRIRQDVVVFRANSGNAAVLVMVGPDDSFDDLGFDLLVKSME